jgi:hypothetical protein
MTYLRTFNFARGFLALSALSLAVAVPALKPAEAVPNYDGMWSVVIVTEMGLCERAYRAPIRISKGHVASAGSGAYTITGRVGKDGAVTVLVSQGDKSATGTGRLSGKTGGGSWSGGPCAGTWQAERRS